MNWIRSGISCFTFGKRSASIKKHINRLLYVGWNGRNSFLLSNGKTNSCCHLYNIKQFNLLSTRKTGTLFWGQNIGQLTQFGEQTGCHRQHNILQVKCFGTSQKENVTPSASPAATNEHWGPYLVGQIHSLEESSRFRGYSVLRLGLSIVAAALVGVYVFRDRLRDNVADEVADVASRSMADGNVILKAHEMTKGVLEKLTSEEDTTILVSEFLKTVLQQNEVRNIAVSFAISILNHPQSQEKLQDVFKNTLHTVLNNRETKDLLLGFIKRLIEDPQTKETCNLFLQALTKDPDIQKVVSEFFKSVLASPTFQMEAVTLGREVTNKVVHDKDLQKQTGDALWNAMKYGVTPYWFRGEK